MPIDLSFFPPTNILRTDIVGACFLSSDRPYTVKNTTIDITFEFGGFRTQHKKCREEINRFNFTQKK